MISFHKTYAAQHNCFQRFLSTISEGSWCDTKDWSDDAEIFSLVITGIK